MAPFFTNRRLVGLGISLTCILGVRACSSGNNQHPAVQPQATPLAIPQTNSKAVLPYQSAYSSSDPEAQKTIEIFKGMINPGLFDNRNNLLSLSSENGEFNYQVGWLGRLTIDCKSGIIHRFDVSGLDVDVTLYDESKNSEMKPLSYRQPSLFDHFYRHWVPNHNMDYVVSQPLSKADIKIQTEYSQRCSK